jgi:hypothetical protein
VTRSEVAGSGESFTGNESFAGDFTVPVGRTAEAGVREGENGARVWEREKMREGELGQEREVAGSSKKFLEEEEAAGGREEERAREREKRDEERKKNGCQLCCGSPGNIFDVSSGDMSEFSDVPPPTMSKKFFFFFFFE